MNHTSKVIIVGNNPVLLEKNYGKLIDSYDIVIRINRCITKGLEQHTGTKLDIWATTHNHWYKDKFIPDNFNELSALWYRTPGVKKSLKTPFSIEVPTYVMYKNKDFKNNFSQYVEKKGYALKGTKKIEFDTGLLTILTSTLFYKDITIVGFDFFEKYDGFSKNVEGYYRNFESNDNKHPEDKLWKDGKRLVNKTFKIKNKIIKELINVGKIKAVDYR